MKNTIFLDSDFNFLLLESEENDANSIYIKFHTSEATNQQLKFLVADNPAYIENLQSDTDININLPQSLWAENSATVLQLSNNQMTSGIIKLSFANIPDISAALNRISNNEFILREEGQDNESENTDGGAQSGDFDFVEVIRNIQHRLLDEPSETEGAYDQFTQEVKIGWTDPEDITTDEPVPAEWAGTVVVRKDGSAPKHRWDGVVEIVDSTTRDEYSNGAYLIDNTAEENKNYYYGIFPYDTRGWYRYTKVLAIETKPIPAPEITSLRCPKVTAFIGYEISGDYTWDYVKLVYKKNSEPASNTDGSAIDIAGTESTTIDGLSDETLYYFKIFAQEHTSGREFASVARAIRSGKSGLPAFTEIIEIIKGGGELMEYEEVITITKL